MHYAYDPQADALYIYLREDSDVDKTVEIDDRRNVDLDDAGKVIGIEVLSPGPDFPVHDLIDRFQLAEFKEFLESVASTAFKPRGDHQDRVEVAAQRVMAAHAEALERLGE